MEEPHTLKEAYDKWLEDVSAMTRKRKTKKRSKRIVALRQLQRPTESSASKSAGPTESTNMIRTDTLPIAVDRDAALASQQEAQRRRFQILADEANYEHHQHDQSVEPGLAFFAMLARQLKVNKRADQRAKITRAETPGFPVRVPPTVLKRSGEEEVVLLFTIEQEAVEPQQEAESGKSRRSSQPGSSEKVRQGNAVGEWTLQLHYFSSQEIFESRLPWIQRVLLSPRDQDASSSSPLAVMKTLSSSPNKTSNNIELLDSPARVEDALRALWDRHAEHQQEWQHQAIQAFVPSASCASNNSQSKAWLARPAYRKKDRGATVVWILTGNDSTMASTWWRPGTTSQPCQIVKCVNAQSWREPRLAVESLSQWLELQIFRPANLGTVGELVIDLAQDLRGQWWLLEIKAVQVRKSHGALPSMKDNSSRARSAPERLETASVCSTTSKSLQFAKVKWKCGGKYCDQDMEVSQMHEMKNEPSGYLTKKELLCCEFYDKYQGSSDASVLNGCTRWSDALAFYLQHQLHKRDRTILYEPQPLCAACLHSYHRLRVRYTDQVAFEQGADASGHKLPRKKKSIAVSRSLPALVGAAKQSAQPVASISSQSLASSTDLTASTGLIELSTATPSYMEDLERIERLLADDHAPARIQQPAEQPTPPTHDSTMAYGSSTSSFSWAQFSSAQNDRVEEMWQSIRLKPLQKVSKSEPTHSRCSVSVTVSMGETNCSSKRAGASEEPHLVSLSDCRRVFSDDLYRDSLIAETKQRLLTRKQPVRFVVLSDDGAYPTANDPDASLARVALRSLALDISQALEQEGASLPRGLPPVDEDAVGGVSMTVSM